MDERVIKFRVGVMVLATLIIAGILVLLFGDTPSLMRDDYTIYMHFNDAPGVTEGTPVRKSGILIGRVKSVRFAEQGGVIVEAEIYRDVKLYRSEVPQVSGSLLGGDVVIQFVNRGTVPSEAPPPAAEQNARRRGPPTRLTGGIQNEPGDQQPAKPPQPIEAPRRRAGRAAGRVHRRRGRAQCLPGDQQHAGGLERGNQGLVQRRH